MDKGQIDQLKAMAKTPGWRVWTSLKREARESLQTRLSSQGISEREADFIRGQLNELVKEIDLNTNLADTERRVLD
jgi:hypothetical protein